MHRALTAFGLLLWVSSTALAYPQASLTSTETSLIKFFDGNLTLKPSTSKDDIDRSTLPKAAMQASSGSFLETFGPGKGKEFTRTVKATKTYPKTWPASTAGAVTETIPGDLVLYQILDPKRGLVAPLGLDMHQAVQVAYEPGELMIPMESKLAAYDMKLKVYSLTDPTKVTHTGDLKVTSTDRGQWTVDVPGGSFECVMYTITYDGKVGPASVKDTAIVFVNAKEGVIAKVTRSKVSAFLVYSADDRFAYVKAKN